jgi:hypothetical protein
MTSDPGPSSLAELEARLRRDVELLVLPPAKDWLEPRTHPEYGAVLDVAVIGAGMSGACSGLCAEMPRGRALAHLRPLGRKASRARGRPSRAHGDVALAAGAEAGRVRLSQPHVRAWFEAQFGRAAWKKVHRIRGCNGWTTCAGTAS